MNIWLAPLLAFALLNAAPEDLPEMVPMEVPLTERGYALVDRQHGVRVYEHQHADIIRIAAEGRFAAPPERVQQVLLDYERHAGRVERVSVSRVLARRDERMLVYQRLNLPLISDRDFNLLVRWGEDEGRRWIHYRTASQGRPARPGVVRVCHHRGSWQLEALPGGRGSRARYQSSIDMAGMLPRWMARSGVGDEVPGLFTAIRKMLAEDR